MTKFWYGVLGLFSVLTIGFDVVTSPYVQFPILFVVPVGLGAWYIGRGAAVAFAVGMVVSRFALVVTFEREAVPLWAAVVNAGIRLLVLVGLAAFVSTARQSRTLARRVQLLEGFLPICMFCKSIRGQDGGWEQIEAYIKSRSDATFSHGLCEACARKNYPDIFPPEEGVVATRPTPCDGGET